MKLVQPTMVYATSFEEAMKERDGAEHVMAIDPAIAVHVKSTEDYIRIRNDHAKGKNLPEGWVPATTYWLIDKGEVMGETHIRHKLTEHLHTEGGHIGYWIRSSKRHQGYGKKILELALEKTKELGIERVLVTCDETNEWSKRIIESNGGVLEEMKDVVDGKPRKLLYWIELE